MINKKFNSSALPSLFSFRKLSLLIILISIVSIGGVGYFYLEKKGCFPLEENVISIPKININSSTVRFIAMGDTGTGNGEQKKVSMAIRNVCMREVCDFVLLLGDNFYPEGVQSVNDQQFETKFDSIYKSINLPFIAILGNHDVSGRPLSQVLYSKKNTRWVMPNYSYQFKVGAAQFFAINSACGLYAGNQLKQQLESVKEKAPWNFILSHQPIYGSGTHGDADPVLRWFWQEFFQEKFDFFLSGHDHELEHLKYENDQTDYIISGAGGKHYRSSEERAKTTTSIANSIYAYQDIGFAWFEVDPSNIKIKFYDEKGKAVYEYNKKK